MHRLGWTEADLAAAAVPTVKALRWSLFVEAVWPKNAAEIQAPLTADEPEASRIARFKAQEALRDLRGLLFPADDGDE